MRQPFEIKRQLIDSLSHIHEADASSTTESFQYISHIYQTLNTFFASIYSQQVLTEQQEEAPYELLFFLEELTKAWSIQTKWLTSHQTTLHELLSYLNEDFNQSHQQMKEGLAKAEEWNQKSSQVSLELSELKKVFDELKDAEETYTHLTTQKDDITERIAYLRQIQEEVKAGGLAELEQELMKLEDRYMEDAKRYETLISRKQQLLSEQRELEDRFQSAQGHLQYLEQAPELLEEVIDRIEKHNHQISSSKTTELEILRIRTEENRILSRNMLKSDFGEDVNQILTQLASIEQQLAENIRKTDDS